MAHRCDVPRILALLALAAPIACSSSSNPQSTMLSVNVATEDGLDVHPTHSYSFEVTDGSGARVSTKIARCFTNNVCDIAVELNPTGPGEYQPVRVAVYDNGAYVGRGVTYVDAKMVGTSGPRPVRVSPLAHGLRTLYLAARLGNEPMSDVASRLALVWGKNGPDQIADRHALVGRMSAFAVAAKPASANDAAQSLLTLSHSRPPVQAIRDAGSVTVTPKLSEGLPPNKHWDRASRASSVLEFAGWGLNLTKFIFDACEQDANKGLEGIQDIENTIGDIKTTVDAIQLAVQALATQVTQNSVAWSTSTVSHDFNVVTNDVMQYGEPLQQINIICKSYLDEQNAPGNVYEGATYKSTPQDMETCLSDATTRQKIESQLSNLFGDGANGAFTYAGKLTSGLNSNASITTPTTASVSGDLATLMMDVYNATSLLGDFKFESVWMKGPYEVTYTANATGATWLMTLMSFMLQYQSLGTYILTNWPGDTWSTGSNNMSFTLTQWNDEFPSQAERSVVASFFTGECQTLTGSTTCPSPSQVPQTVRSATPTPRISTGEQLYKMPGDAATLAADLSQSGIVTFSPQTGLTLGNLSSDGAKGTCAILDFDKTNSVIYYQCDGTSYNPTHNLFLANCNGYSGSSSSLSSIKLWYVNATGTEGDGFLACDDTLIGDKVGAAIGGNAKAVFVGTQQHPGANPWDPPPDPSVQTPALNSDVHHEIHVYTLNADSNYPSNILAATSGNGLQWRSSDGNALWDGGTNTIYSALIKFDHGQVFELMHDFLGTNAGSEGTNASAVFIRCPLGFALDCRPMFSDTSGCSYDNGIIINGWKLLLSSSSASGSSCDTSTYFSQTGQPQMSTYSGGNAWIWWERYSAVVALPAAAPLVTGKFTPDFSYNASPNAWGTQVFLADGLSLPLGSAVQVRATQTLGYELVMQQDHNLVLYQCTDSPCANGFPIWASNTKDNSSVASAVFTEGGHLVLQDSSGKAVWDQFGAQGATTTPTTPTSTTTATTTTTTTNTTTGTTTTTTTTTPTTTTTCMSTGTPTTTTTGPTTNTTTGTTTTTTTTTTTCRPIFAVQDDGNMVIYNSGNLPNPFGNGAVVSSGTNIQDVGSHGWSAPSFY